LSYLYTNKAPGDTAVLTILRDGKSMDVTVTLGKRQ
jgi:S1-C subfamily serine protease